jgi:4-amino-4-deoxy-L-arabinose transferase-like glycosyltransferase
METKLLDTLLAPEIIALAAAIIALLFGLNKVPIRKTTLGNLRWWRRLLPILPLVFGVAGAFTMGQMNGDAGMPFHHPLLLGLWAGFLAAHGRKVVKRLFVDKVEKADAGKDQGEV